MNWVTLAMALSQDDSTRNTATLVLVLLLTSSHLQGVTDNLVRCTSRYEHSIADELNESVSDNAMVVTESLP